MAVALCYREDLHIGVGVLSMILMGSPAWPLGWFLEICMMPTNVFMFSSGIKLVQATWHRSMADPAGLSGPLLSAGPER